MAAQTHILITTASKPPQVVGEDERTSRHPVPWEGDFPKDLQRLEKEGPGPEPVKQLWQDQVILFLFPEHS